MTEIQNKIFEDFKGIVDRELYDIAEHAKIEDVLVKAKLK